VRAADVDALGLAIDVAGAGQREPVERGPRRIEST
jgi:hypothetical protein